MKRWHFSIKDQKEIALLVGVVLALLIFLIIAVGKSGAPAEHHEDKDRLAKTYTFPNGGRQIFPAYRVVALYGTPGSPVLGALGEQNMAASITRVKDLAAQYQPLATEHILPAFEIIATIASGSPTSNNDYSQETDAAKLRPWVDAARHAGVYVVLDLQPGRSDFLRQAKQYAELLKQPNVGLALDPEWRLGPDQEPLKQVGSVSVTEVNGVVSWLAKLTRDNKLPQKLLVLHQFRTDMLPDRDKLDTSRNELAYVIQMDGQGDQPTKLATWQTITASPPANVQFGWKNFYQKDSPTLDPTGTMALTPKPWYVSYQ